MKTRRQTVLLLLVVTLLSSAPLFAQKGTYRAEFQRATGFAYSPVYSTVPNGGFTSSSGDAKTSFVFAFDPVVPATEVNIGTTNPLQTVRFDQPLRPSVSVTVNWKAPYDTKPDKTFNASLKLEVQDWGATPKIDLCTQVSEAQTVQQSGSATFTINLEGCSISVLRAFNRSYVTNQTEILFLATLLVDGKTGGGDRLHVHYQVIPNYDSVYAYVTTPAQLSLVRGGTSQAFAGTISGYPGTRFDADVELLLVDGNLQVLGKTTPARVTRYDVSKPFSMPAVALPAITGDLYLLALMTAPGTSNVLASYPIRVHIEECVLRGLIRRNSGDKDYWLPDVPVGLFEHPSLTDLGRTQSRQRGTLERPRSEYCFTAAQLPAGWSPVGKNVQPVVALRDAPIGGKGTIMVSEKPESAGQPIQVAWTPFSIANSNRRDLNVHRGAGALVAPPQTDIAAAEAGAEVYWHLWRQTHVMWPVNSATPLARNLPVNVLMNGTASYYCPEAGPPVCPLAAVISLGPKDSVPGANPSVLWHEFGHHVVKELYEAKEIPRPGPSDPLLNLSHNGYANAYTSDSMDEGFATFWAAASSRVFERELAGRGMGIFRWNDPSPENSGSIFLETNDQMADPQKPAFPNPVPAKEEQAVAGILWDLTDSVGDLEKRYGATFYDTAGIDLSDVLTVLRKKPGSVLKLYDALNANHPDLAQGAPGQTRVDQIFLMHGAFHDKNADGLYQPGEDVGRAANGATWMGYALDAGGVNQEKAISPRPTRESLPQISGSTIAVTLTNPEGTLLPVSLVEVTIDHGPGYEALNTKQLLKVTASNLYFQMPPPSYQATATLRVPGSTAPPLVIDGQTYWSKVPANGSFMSHTFVVPPDVPQLDSVYPTYGAAGTQITLSGRNFAPVAAGNTVMFGAERAAIISASTNTLLVTVPGNLKGGTVEASVTSSDNTSNATEFEVLAPSFQLEEATLGFGDVALGQNADKTLTVSNTGDAPLIITSVASNGPFTSLMPVTPQVPFMVEAGTERKITVRFSPAKAVPSSSSLVIVTNDLSRRTATVVLTGNGVASGPDIAPSPEGLGFGSVAVGQNRTATLSITNAGNASLTVTSATVSPTAFTLVSATVPFTLAPGASQALNLRFAPDLATPYAGSLLLASNDPDRPAFTVTMNGTGVAGGAPQNCTYAVTPVTRTAGAGAGTGSVNVTAPAGCGWTASTSASFVTLSASGGSGNGTVNYQLLSNDTGRFRTGKLLVAGSSVDVTQEAEASSTTTVPIVLTSSGVGNSSFTSELTLTNRGQSDAVAELTYTAAFGGGTGAASDIVPAGAQLIFPDAISYLQSLGIPIPLEENRGGTLRVTFTGGSSPSAGSATVRTASLVPEGRAGLAYGAVPRGAALTGTSYLCGLRQNATDRSNVAIVNAGRAGEGDVVVRLTVFSGDPANPGSKVLSGYRLPPGGWAQISGILGSNGLSLTNGWVKIERVEGSAPYYAYGVINDQANSDGSFVPPVLGDVLAGRKGISLPVAVEASPYSTELVLTNFGNEAKSFQVTFVADSIQAAGNAASIPFTLNPGEQRIIPDFVEYLRSQHVAGIGVKGTGFAGAVFLTVASGDVSGLFIGGRTSSPGGGGQYGVFYTGVPQGAAATGSAFVYGLQQNAENRSNLALVNTGEVDGSVDTFKIEIFNGSTGGLARQVLDISVGPKKWMQIGGILTLYAPEVTNAYLKVTRTAGNNPFIVYGVVNDGTKPGERTGDGAFFAMDATE